MNRKYELLKDDTIEVFEKTLFRIRATESFAEVEKGEKGGYVESYNNLTDNARVTGSADTLAIFPIGSRDDCVTFFRCDDKKIHVAAGCFRGTIDEFAAAVQKTHGGNEHAQAYNLAIRLAKLRMEGKK